MSHSTEIEITVGLRTYSESLGSRALAEALDIPTLESRKFVGDEARHVLQSPQFTNLVDGTTLLMVRIFLNEDDDLRRDLDAVECSYLNTNLGLKLKVSHFD